MVQKYLRATGLFAVAAVAIVASFAIPASAVTSPKINAVKTNASAPGALVVAVGDSILEGHGLESNESWIAQLALRDNFDLVNLASDGSGFVTAGNNDDTFADQIKAAVALKANIVILSGSSNDLGQSDAAIEAATDAAVSHLHAALPGAQIIAVSGIWGDSAAPEQMTNINYYVETAVTAVGGTYLRIGQPLGGKLALMQADDVHPTADGQASIARHVQKALDRVGETL